ncbi:hypothetical protein [Stratiformator vulcanicus]|uniref:Peptidase family M50 n=1 Tax=Stratiformator vulcanicus TaxID=2527980 RepID=A0A517QWZ5_9PLAN|nr:hypothetical protein [Stratiformator vulcanicus]QDT36185.1 Peptidase family M50 [Stratiformator vulcanicus]
MSANSIPIVEDRPLPVRGRRDLRFEQVRFAGEVSWIVSDPVSGDYHRISPVQYLLLQSLDGLTSLAALARTIERVFPFMTVSSGDVQRDIQDLHTKNFCVVDRTGQHAVIDERATKREKRQRFSWLRNPLFISLSLVDVSGLLSALAPVGRLIFTRDVFALTAALIAVATFGLVAQVEQLALETTALLAGGSWSTLALFWVTIGLAKVCHEFGHALACRRFGAYCSDIGVALLLFSPCLYCDVSDAWRLPNKTHRLIIGAAGVWFELTLMSIGFFVWSITLPGPIHTIALCWLIVTSVGAVLFNLNPLLRYDGYHLLADYFETPNLRQRARTAVRKMFGRMLFRGESGRASTPEPLWIPIYGMLSGLYQMLMLLFIAQMFFRWSSGYGLGAVATLAVAGMVWGQMRNWGNAMRLTFREQSRSGFRPAGAMLMLMLFGGVGYAFVAVPIPRFAVVPSELEPTSAPLVFSAIPGQLIDLHVAVGERVEQGQLIATVRSRPLEDSAITQQTRIGRLRTEQARRIAMRDHAGLILASAAFENAAEVREQLTEHQRKCEVRAPRAGIIGPVPDSDRRSKTEIDVLADGAIGAFIDRGTPLCSVNDESQWRLAGLLNAEERDAVGEQDEIEFRFVAEPETVYRGRIIRILPFVTDDGREEMTRAERLADAVGLQGGAKHRRRYRIEVVPHELPEFATRGLTAEIRIPLRSRTAFEFSRRWFHESFVAPELH